MTVQNILVCILLISLEYSLLLKFIGGIFTQDEENSLPSNETNGVITHLIMYTM